MIRISKALTILLILTIGSGCTTTKGVPLCLPDRPTLQDLSISEQQQMTPETLTKVALNDMMLKLHIKSIEELTAEHNRQFKGRCDSEGVVVSQYTDGSLYLYWPEWVEEGTLQP